MRVRIKMGRRPITAVLLVGTVALFVLSCAPTAPIPDGSPGATSSQGPGYDIVTVYYGTNRNQDWSSGNRVPYGSEPAELSYGQCRVSIPVDHRMGHLESASVFRLEFAHDPTKHVALLSVEPRSFDEFFLALQSRATGSPTTRAFVFVHGYNVKFEDAARRTAQLAYDLDFDGAPIFYSWPSKGRWWRYRADERNVELSIESLREFLLDIAAKSGASEIHIIAHSMGNRCLTRALERMSDQLALGADQHPFRQIVLAAPDIDAELFKIDIAPKFLSNQAGIRVTLYASSHDKALKMSRRLHGNYPRLGESGERLVVLDGMDTIDASLVDTSLSGHAYYVEGASILADLFYVLKDGAPPDDRHRLEPSDAGAFWRFRP